MAHLGQCWRSAAFCLSVFGQSAGELQTNGPLFGHSLKKNVFIHFYSFIDFHQHFKIFIDVTMSNMSLSFFTLKAF